jgi:hypothetical protein
MACASVKHLFYGFDVVSETVARRASSETNILGPPNRPILALFYCIPDQLWQHYQYIILPDVTV